MTASSPQLHPAAAPLAIAVLDGGRSFRVVLTEPEDAEVLADALWETNCRELRWNRDYFEWVGTSRHPEAIAYLYRVIEELQDAWLEAHEEAEPPPVLALPPAPPEVGKGTRGLIQMAEEMGVDYRELEQRLRNGWPYKVTERKATLIPIEGTTELEHRVEYFFNKAHAKWNVENRDKVKEPARKRPVEIESEEE